LKELTSSKIEGLDNRVTREGEISQREINAVRTESENRISAREASYREVNQANEDRSQAQYDAIMTGINRIRADLPAMKAEQQEIKSMLPATKNSVDEMKNFFTVDSEKLLWALGSALFGACVTLWSFRKQLGWG
jgi:riboflavin biosynthesis pyrimidine reductase